MPFSIFKTITLNYCLLKHETQPKQQSSTEKMLFEVGTKVLRALTEIGTHAGKAYVDDHFKNKRQPIQQSLHKYRLCLK